MKRQTCLILAVVLALCAGFAAAEQKVSLPASSYTLTLPDGLEYDGPGSTEGDDAEFAYASYDLGLEVYFLLHDGKGVTLEDILQELKKTGQDADLYMVNGIKMLVYRVDDPDQPPKKGMKCIGYTLIDGDRVQEIVFWYANQAAADLTKEIMGSINKE